MRGARGIIVLAAALAAADQAAKWLLARHLPLGGRVRLAPFLDLVHVRNTGAAFGLGDDGRWTWLLLILGVAGVIVMIYLARRLASDPVGGTGLGLALGGAAGNQIDRARLGAVTDFADFHAAGWHWPAFNLADVCLTVGFGLLAWMFLRERTHD